MDWAALILWVLTAGGGFVLLAIWLKAGGMSQRSSGRIRPAVILTHLGLAAAGIAS
jgi:manganese efflux pump family protein